MSTTRFLILGSFILMASMAAPRFTGTPFAAPDVSTETRSAEEPQPALPSSAGGGGYCVVLGSWAQVSEANAQVSDLRRQGYLPLVMEDAGYQKVYLGPFATMNEAVTMRARMVAEGFLLARVEKIEPEIMLPPMEAAAATRRRDLETSEVFQSEEWRRMTPAQKEQVIGLVMKQRAQREGLVTVADIADLKTRVSALDSDQKRILNRLEDEEKKAADRQREIQRLLRQVNLKQDQGDLEGAMSILRTMEDDYPNEPIVIFKKRSLEMAMKDQFEGFDVLERKEAARITQMEAQAAQLARDGVNPESLRQARDLYRNIVLSNPRDEEMRQRAEREVGILNERIQTMEAARRQQEDSLRQKQNRLIFGAIGGFGLLLIVLLFAGYIAGRRRYARMLQQLQEEAISPLQELQQKTRRIASSSAGAGLSFAGENQSLIEEAEPSSAEFMIPETGTEEEPAPDTGLFDGGGGMPDLSDMSIGDFSADDSMFGAPEAPAVETPEETPSSEDDFMMDFAPAAQAPSGSSLPQIPGEAEESGEMEELVFSFDDDIEPPPPPKAESTSAPITASEVSPQIETPPGEDIVFSFDDTGSGAGAAAMAEHTLEIEPPPPADSEKKTGTQDSVYDSIPLGDLNLDVDLGDLESTTPSLAPEDTSQNPLADNLDFNLEIEETPPPAPLGAQKTTPVSAPGDAGLTPPPVPAGFVDETIPVAASAGAGASASGYFTQDFHNDPAGSMPSGWTGESVPYASLTVEADPDGVGGKCLLFEKTRGEGPTSFACVFPPVSGKICVEFEIRCDRKNKHLLGFYIEKDGDFRRSIHTVVQCVDPNSPAHLRVFTRPTPYEMKTWRRVKYIVDLTDGLVDGYVGDQLVAEGVRMGTRTDSLNTFSIRDNSESTGSLYLRNLAIRPADEEM